MKEDPKSKIILICYVTRLFCLKQTFMRQKVTLESPASPSAMLKTQEDLNLKVENPTVLKSNHPAKTESSSSMKGDGTEYGLGEGEFPPVKHQNGSTYGDFSEEGCICDDICHRTEQKPLAACLKANESIASAGALRYALHLRFLCPFPKKGSKSVEGKEAERRFYLYNDLRVVFPQRHSDADEGKVCIRCSRKRIIHAVSLFQNYLQRSLHFNLVHVVGNIGIYSKYYHSSSLRGAISLKKGNKELGLFFYSYYVHSFGLSCKNAAERYVNICMKVG